MSETTTNTRRKGAQTEGGESSDHGAEVEHESNGGERIIDGIKSADIAHGAYEALELTKHARKAGTSVWETVAESVHEAPKSGVMGSKAMSALMGPIAFAGGLFETMQGAKELSEGKTAREKGDGMATLTQGVAGMAGGAGSTLAALGLGGSVAASASPVMAAAAGGAWLGNFGDHEATRLGYAEVPANAGVAVEDWVTKKTGSATAGNVAGAVTSLAVGVPVAVGSALLGTYERVRALGGKKTKDGE